MFVGLLKVEIEPFLHQLLFALIEKVPLLPHVKTLDPLECLLNKDGQGVAEAGPLDVKVVLRQ